MTSRQQPQGQRASVKMASALVAWASCLLLGATVVEGKISEGCVRCLCEAVAGGPFCEYGGSCHDGVCGPYSITLPYWQDGGRPTVALDDRLSSTAYERCALDNTCAEATIRGYMARFHQDCNGDGKVNCRDYVAIHFHGGYGCNKPLSVPAQNALNSCLQKLKDGVQAQPPPPPPDLDNDIHYPPEQTTLPQIDIRFGE